MRGCNGNIQAGTAGCWHDCLWLLRSSACLPGIIKIRHRRTHLMFLCVKYGGISSVSTGLHHHHHHNNDNDNNNSNKNNDNDDDTDDNDDNDIDNDIDNDDNDIDNDNIDDNNTNDNNYIINGLFPQDNPPAQNTVINGVLPTENTWLVPTGRLLACKNKAKSDMNHHHCLVCSVAMGNSQTSAYRIDLPIARP